MHSNEEEVSKGLKMSPREQSELFARLRKKGIKKRNMEEATKESPIFESMKKCHGQVVHCRYCDGCYSKNYFYRHKQRCQQQHSHIQPGRPRYIAPHLLNSSNEDREFQELLSTLQIDNISKIIVKEPCIQSIGQKLFLKDRAKVDKTHEVRKSVRTTMRMLARLLECFRRKIGSSVHTEEMFHRKNFEHLCEAVRELSAKDDDEIKYGLKHNLYYTLTSSAEILQAITLQKEPDVEKSKEYELFLKVLRMNQNLVFGDSKYQINKARQERLRLPTRCPEEEHIEELRDYLLRRIDQLSCIYSQIDQHTFVDLRNCICSRLTLFNARRSNEPCRIKVTQWTGRNKWVKQDMVNKLGEADKKLFNSLDILYMTGKGNHVVPCLVPLDCRRGLDLLVDENIRRNAGVSSTNKYLFPSTENSQTHIIGWNAIRTICDKAGVQAETINATNQRARISTIFAALDLREEDRDYFYRHMGHSSAVNQGTYQRPLPIMEVIKVGQHLKNIDQGMFDISPIPIQIR